MKSLTNLLQVVLNDIGDWCHTSTVLDFKRIEDRIEHEGLSFLTITLPTYGKDFEKSLDRGYVDHDLFKSFSFRGGLPQLFGGFLDLVFDRGSGRLLDSPSIEAIQGIRQITLMFSKVQIPCSDARNEAALAKYIQCEKDVRKADKRFTGDIYDAFCKMSDRLWRDFFTYLDWNVYEVNITPKHGPGVTADRLYGNQKYRQTEWTTRLEDYFPSAEFMFPTWQSYMENMNDVRYLEPGEERPVKVILVPKTLKTPRIIAVEPTCMQYTQQALLELIENGVEGFDTPRDFIRWKSQVPNQDLSMRASIDGSLATLDLSEASDRVSNQHVRAMLRSHPHIAGAVDACRSRKADVPGYGVKRLAKFASMGSALCFPFEAMVFLTVVMLGIQNALNRPLTLKDIKSLKGQVRIYGDDIIVPVEYVNHVIDSLGTFGFLVNSDKSFWTGKFRESCGKEYYDGHDVTIVRCRQLLPSSRGHVQEIEATVAMRNLFYKRGFWPTCRFLDSLIEEFIPFPAVAETSPGLGKLSALGYETHRTHPDYQSPLVKAAVSYHKLPNDNLEGDGALLKFFLKRSELPFADRKHLERAGRPVAVGIKHRWVSPF